MQPRISLASILAICIVVIHLVYLSALGLFGYKSIIDPISLEYNGIDTRLNEQLVNHTEERILNLERTVNFISLDSALKDAITIRADLLNQTDAIRSLCAKVTEWNQLEGTGILFSNDNYIYCSRRGLDVMENQKLSQFALKVSYETGRYDLILTNRETPKLEQYSWNSFTQSKAVSNVSSVSTNFDSNTVTLYIPIKGSTAAYMASVHYQMFYKTIEALNRINKTVLLLQDGRLLYYFLNGEQDFTLDELGEVIKLSISNPNATSVRVNDINYSISIVQCFESMPFRMQFVTFSFEEQVTSGIQLAIFMLVLLSFTPLLFGLAVIFIECLIFSEMLKSLATLLQKFNTKSLTLKRKKYDFFSDSAKLEKEFNETKAFLQERKEFVEQQTNNEAEFYFSVRPSAIKKKTTTKMLYSEDSDGAILKSQEILNAKSRQISEEIDLNLIAGVAYTGKNYKKRPFNFKDFAGKLMNKIYGNTDVDVEIQDNVFTTAKDIDLTLKLRPETSTEASSSNSNKVGIMFRRQSISSSSSNNVPYNPKRRASSVQPNRENSLASNLSITSSRDKPGPSDKIEEEN